MTNVQALVINRLVKEFNVDIDIAEVEKMTEQELDLYLEDKEKKLLKDLIDKN